jgi:coniferyl-aldehyde dehydrogenase
VGRQVMRAAAEHLTPVTLELGGKSPALFAPGAVQARYVKRLAFAKLLNAGQTCIAPDYALVHESELDTFKTLMLQAAQALYGSMASPDYTSIINERHDARLQGLLDDAQGQGAHVTSLLPGSVAARQLAPALLLNVTDHMKIMQEEIFGPLLPVVSYGALDQALAYIQQRPRPLALYVFDDQARRVKQVLRHTHSGGVCINDCVLQVAQDDLPFGGIGASGMGRYHGPEGFKTFSNVRSVFRQSRLSATSMLQPPYGRAWVEHLIRFMLRR